VLRPRQANTNPGAAQVHAPSWHQKESGHALTHMTGWREIQWGADGWVKSARVGCCTQKQSTASRTDNAVCLGPNRKMPFEREP
jgi:hypothetical protein